MQSRANLHLPILPALAVISLLACSPERNRITGNTEDPPPDFTLGASATYPVSGTHAQTLADSITGMEFAFPMGGNGGITVSEISSGPAAPYAGEGFYLDASGIEQVDLLVDASGVDAVMLMTYSQTPAAYDDELAARERWLAMPMTDSTEGTRTFQLDIGYGGAAKEGQVAAATARNYYWVSKITAGSDDADKRLLIRAQCQAFASQFVDSLPPSLRTWVANEIAGRLAFHSAWDGSYYSGFWWRSLGTSGRMVYPTIHLPLTAAAGTVAHETGHYLVHTLLGDDVESTLEGQGNLYFDHQIGDDNQRAKLLEEYAYFLEYFFTGEAGTYKCENPYNLWGGLRLSPSATDLPGREGFGLLMLSGLTRTGDTVQSIFNPAVQLQIPVLGLPFSRAFEIIAAGATDINGLRAEIQSSLTAAQNTKYQVIMQRSGWQYGIEGHLRDKNGDPLPDVLVSNVITAGGTTYAGGFTSIPSNSQGRFSIVGEIFPGRSQLRCVLGSDTAFVDIDLDWNAPTHQKVNVGYLTVDFDNLLADLQSMERITISIVGDHQSTWGPMDDYISEFNPVFRGLIWDGTGFEGERVQTGATWNSRQAVNGTVSADGRRIVSVSWTYTFRSSTPEAPNGILRQETDTAFTITDIGFNQIAYGQMRYSLTGPVVGSHVSITHRELTEWEDEEFGTEITEYTGTNWNSTAEPPSIEIYFTD